MLFWVAVFASGGLAVLALRSMAYAFASTVDAHGGVPLRPHRSRVEPRRSYYSSREAAMLMLEIALSVGIACAIVGLAAMAALPGRLMIGALLAQVAVLGSLVAPPVSISCRSLHLRPAAIALGVAQLANAAFFVRAIVALI